MFWPYAFPVCGSHDQQLVFSLQAVIAGCSTNMSNLFWLPVSVLSLPTCVRCLSSQALVLSSSAHSVLPGVWVSRILMY
jgi:hypothetical protein